MKHTTGWLTILLGLAGCHSGPVADLGPQDPCQMQMVAGVDDPSAMTAAGLSVEQAVERVAWQSDTVHFAWGESVVGAVSVDFEPNGGASEMEYGDAPGEVCGRSGVYLVLSGHLRVEVEGWVSADESASLGWSSVDEGVVHVGNPIPLESDEALRFAFEEAIGESCTVFRPVARLGGSSLLVDVLGTCGGHEIDEPLFEVMARD